MSLCHSLQYARALLILSNSDFADGRALILDPIQTLLVFFRLRVRRFLSTRRARSFLDLGFDIALGAILVASKCAESRGRFDETDLQREKTGQSSARNRKRITVDAPASSAGEVLSSAHDEKRLGPPRQVVWSKTDLGSLVCRSGRVGPLDDPHSVAEPDLAKSRRASAEIDGVNKGSETVLVCALTARPR